MPKYIVTLTARVYEVAQVEIEAADEDAAEMIARRDAPSYEWERLDNDDVEVEVEVEPAEGEDE